MTDEPNHARTAAANAVLATTCVFGSLAMYVYGITDTAILYMLVAIYLRIVAKESIDAHNTDALASALIPAILAAHSQSDNKVRNDS